MLDELEQDSISNSWDQLPGESDIWYGRFKLYLQLGPLRTLQETRQLTAKSKNRTVSSGSTGLFSAAARRWYWRERASAWDTYQRNLFALSDRNTRLALRQRRVGVMEETLEAIRAALDTADIAQADQELARAWLPQLRVFLRDMLVAERQEFERDPFDKDDAMYNMAITVDDLLAAQRELEAAQAHVPAPGPGSRRQMERTFLVCVHGESGLTLDLAALRAVRTATGLEFQRLLNPTRQKFARTLRRQSGLGHPIQYVHFALHAAAEGLEFVDGPVDGSWLSEHMGGVRVALLASCACDSVGDWLGVVPYVVTLSEDITHEDAAALAQHFWRGIGLGQDPEHALDEALAYCPPSVAEYVVRHW